MPHPSVAIATKAITQAVSVNIGTVCPDYWLLLALHTLTHLFLCTLVPTEVDRGRWSDQRTSLRPSLALSIQALESHTFAK